MAAKTSMEIVIVQDPRHPETHSLVKVYYKGYVYAARWAGVPTVKQINELWHVKGGHILLRPLCFLPYNESTDTFI